MADDIGVEKAPAHRSTLRPGVSGRFRSRSAPTRGDRRNALRIPPFFDCSPEMVRRTVARIRAESGPSPASQLASGVEPKNLEPDHPSLLEALPVAVQRSFLRRGTHGRFLRISSNISRL